MELIVRDAPTILGHIGPVPIYLFGLTTAVGLIIGTAVALLQADRFNLSLSNVFEFAPWAIIAGVIGARGMYVLIHWNDYSEAMSSILRFGEGGFSFYGAIGAGVVALWVYSRFVPVQPRKMLDALAPGLALGQAVGLIGVQIASQATNMPWGVIVQHTPVHPLPAYGILLAYGLFFVLWRLGGERLAPGTLFLNYLLLHGLGSFFLGIWSAARTFIGLTAGQWLGLAVAAIALTVWFIERHEPLSNGTFSNAWNELTVSTRRQTVGERITHIGLWVSGLCLLLAGFIARLG